MFSRDGQTYAGPYSYDKKSKKVLGCPARALSVRTVLDAINTKSGVKGATATRKHAEAMTVEDLQKMMRWSENECLHSYIDPERVKAVQSVERLQFLTKHGMMRAFSSSGFTLWTR